VIVAIHQPNYAPWLGYFHKLARSDHFVFLDDAQYSKNSYINRVQIDGGGSLRWLSIPVSFSFGDSIAQVRFAEPGWRGAHLDTLKHYYGSAPAFRAAWPRLAAIYDMLPLDNLAAANMALVRSIAKELGIETALHLSSEFDCGELRADERLARIVRALAPGGTYLSGSGGANYQSEATFAIAGLRLTYAEFRHPTYPQGREAFLAGLSILDAVFQLGWEKTAALVAVPRHRAA